MGGGTYGWIKKSERIAQIYRISIDIGVNGHSGDKSIPQNLERHLGILNRHPISSIACSVALN